MLGAGVQLIDSAEATAAQVVKELAARGLAASARPRPEHVFAVSDDEPRFRRVGERFLGERLKQVSVVPLG